MSAHPKRKIAEAHTGEPPVRHETSPLKPVRGAADASASSGVPDFDRVIHERARLAIVSALATSPTRTHNELRDLLALTDGNLSVHARRLEEAGYIACDKDFAGRTPRTTYRLTTAGRKAFDRYLAHMEALIQVMKGRK